MLLMSPPPIFKSYERRDPSKIPKSFLSAQIIFLDKTKIVLCLPPFVAQVNQSNGPRLITLKYFEPGHTIMSADSFHRNVGQRMKKQC